MCGLISFPTCASTEKPRNATWVMRSTSTHVADFLVRCLAVTKYPTPTHPASTCNRMQRISGQEHLIYTGPVPAQQFLSFPVRISVPKLARNPPKTARLIYQIILHNSEHSAGVGWLAGHCWLAFRSGAEGWPR